MQELQEWLKSSTKDFAQGLILLEKYGGSKNAVFVLKNNGINPITKECLERTIRKHYDRWHKHPTPTVDQTKAKAPVNRVLNPVKSKPDVDALKAAANQAYAQMGAIHAKLLAVKTVAERKKLMATFYKHHEEFCSKSSDADHLEAHGTLPEPPKKKVTNAKALSGSDFQRLTLLRSKVSRAERQQIPEYIKANNKIKLERKQADLAAWKEEIKKLEHGNK